MLGFSNNLKLLAATEEDKVLNNQVLEVSF